MTTDKKFEDGYVTIWLDEKGNITNVWVENGSRAIPEQFYFAKKEHDIVFLIEKLHDFKTKEIYLCSTCAKQMKRTDIAHTHFAGVYCEDCAKKYREAHKGRCSLCGSPNSECVC